LRYQNLYRRGELLGLLLNLGLPAKVLDRAQFSGVFFWPLLLATVVVGELRPTEQSS
jgi:hypothetical protein